MSIKAPSKGFIFWPVGTGDSSTVVVNEDTFIQIDIRHMTQSEDEEYEAWPIIDELSKVLPEVDGKPYLSVFVLTHPDKDHCQGFERLLDEVEIGEIWLSPRTFQEYAEKETLCEDALVFHDEALRRVNKTIDKKGDPGSGHRVRIIGYDKWLEKELYKGLPQDFLSIPGHEITTLNGEDCSDKFSAFVHAPFVDDSYGDRNDCSLAFQISLMESDTVGKALIFGDLKYPTLKRIFDVSDDANLEWNILLAPHHCSKSAMYWKNEEDDEEKIRQPLLDSMASSALNPGYVIASSSPIPSKNKSGDNPPHAKAKREYTKIVPNDFMCTHETPNEENPEPLIFELTNKNLEYLGESTEASSVEDSVKSARGSDAPPATAIGFGFDSN